METTGMELSTTDLGSVLRAVFEASTKWYNIGLMLKVTVPTLDRIGSQFDDPTDRLREMLKTWLKIAAKPTWQDITHALRDVTVGHSKPADEIEATYCTTADTGRKVTTPEVQQPIATDTHVFTLQQALQDSRELRIKDQQDSQRRIVTLQQELQAKDKQLQEGQRLIHTLQQELQESHRQVEVLTHQVEEKQHTIDKRETQSKQTIGELRSTIARTRHELQQAVDDKQAAQRQLDELNQRLVTMKHRAAEPQTASMHHDLKETQDTRWQKVSNAPEKMYRGSAASDTCTNKAYFNHDGSTRVYSYKMDTQEWCRLPDAPHTHFTLVVAQRIPTIVGGKLRSGDATSSLLGPGLMGEGSEKRWYPHFPEMPTNRYNTAVVCSGCSLIVAGGEDGDCVLDRVEVLNTDTRQWSVASPLTHPFTSATIAICNEKLYILGGKDQTHNETHSVLSCSVRALLQSCRKQDSLFDRFAGELESVLVTSMWKCVASAPHYWSSCVTVEEKILIAVGGAGADEHSKAIVAYDKRTDSWKSIDIDMPTARHQALVVFLNGKVMVVGGRVSENGLRIVNEMGIEMGIATDVVEIS